MSITSQLFKKQITFNQAVGEFGDWLSKLLPHDPALSAASAAVLSDFKQAASNAVDMAEGSMANYLGPVVDTVGTTFEAMLAKVTNGATIPLNPLITDGIDRAEAALIAEIKAVSVKTKAALASLAPPSPPAA